MDSKTVLAIDPGAAKCGMAIVRRDESGQLQLVWRKVARRDNLLASLDEALTAAPFSLTIVGAGTGSRPLIDELRSAHPSWGILVVDEKDTTLQARERYWEHVKRTGWRRLVPASLQVPPEPFDDFVAMILAERVLAG